MGGRTLAPAGPSAMEPTHCSRLGWQVPCQCPIGANGRFLPDGSEPAALDGGYGLLAFAYDPNRLELMALNRGSCKHFDMGVWDNC